jgi:hypothetical protein
VKPPGVQSTAGASAASASRHLPQGRFEMAALDPDRAAGLGIVPTPAPGLLLAARDPVAARRAAFRTNVLGVRGCRPRALMVDLGLHAARAAVARRRRPVWLVVDALGVLPPPPERDSPGRAHVTSHASARVKPRGLRQLVLPTSLRWRAVKARPGSSPSATSAAGTTYTRVLAFDMIFRCPLGAVPVNTGGRCFRPSVGPSVR